MRGFASLGVAVQSEGCMRDFRKLEVWQLGRRFATLCYEATTSFPKEEAFGLTSQIRRAAVSIPANIAEGVGRDSDVELLRFLRYSLGSLNEVETLFAISGDLNYLGQERASELERSATDLGVRLRNLARKLESAR